MQPLHIISSAGRQTHVTIISCLNNCSNLQTGPLASALPCSHPDNPLSKCSIFLNGLFVWLLFNQFYFFRAVLVHSKIKWKVLNSPASSPRPTATPIINPPPPTPPERYICYNRLTDTDIPLSPALCSLH